MSIIYEPEKRLFTLETLNTTYQFYIDGIGLAEHLYYGKKTGSCDMSYLKQKLNRGFSGNPYEKREERDFSTDTMSLEYSVYGTGDHRINAIGTVSADGSRSLDLRYRDHEISEGKYALEALPHVRENGSRVSTLKLILADETAGCEVTLLYGVFEDKDIITRSALIKNTGKDMLVLTKAASLCLDFPFGSMELMHFYGRHNMERLPERVSVMRGIETVSSNRGMTSHQHNPFVILCDRHAGESSGDCCGIMLMYSGSHSTQIEKDQTGAVRIVSGINSDCFEWHLSPGETFTAPESLMSFASAGFNALSSNFHRIIRENVIPQRFREMERPVLVNNWEGTYFDFTPEKLLAIARRAASLGINMMVLDDGWFGKRRDDNAGLGDWTVNEDVLPGGLKKLSADIEKEGLKFGLWIEPEMINEDSDLFRAHPEWVLTDPGRRPVMTRNQMVLDMSRKDVRDHLFSALSKVIDGASVSYIKWDFNRSLSNIYSNALAPSLQGEVPHRFVLGSYELLDRLTNAYPGILFEGCSGGGGRFDAGIMFYVPQIWCSDNTDPIARLEIQRGTSYGYPVSTMGSHVSASPNHQTGRETSMETRGIVAMSGTFGYELDLSRLTPEDEDTVRRQVTEYKKHRKLIAEGTLYRLTEGDEYYTSWMFVSPDRSEALLSLVVTDVQANAEFPHVKLQGLDPDAVYYTEDAAVTGTALMNGGWSFGMLMGTYPSVQVYFKRQR